MPRITPREKEVLSLVASGLTTKQIAYHLHISYHTVESHRKNLLRKCGAVNTAELIQKNMLTSGHVYLTVSPDRDFVLLPGEKRSA